MARAPNSDLEQLAEQLLPGWTAVSSTESTTRSPGEVSAVAYQDSRDAEADSIMPTDDDLRAKYLGADAPRRDVVDDAGDADAEEDDDTVLVDMRNGPLEKTVAISKAERKVRWSQG